MSRRSLATSLTVAALALTACAAEAAPPPPAATSKTPTHVAVLYEVEGTASSASVTIETPTGTTQDSVDVPMKVKGERVPGLAVDFPPGKFLYISAQNRGSYGAVTCRITVNGQVVSENTASGGYVIATCKGTT